MKVMPYIYLDGTAEAALMFYKDIFSGEIVYVMKFGENPEGCKEGYEDKIMHCQLKVGEDYIYISDLYKDEKMKFGDQVNINVDFDTVEALELAYQNLAKSAEMITFPIKDTFWQAKYGALKDKFGISWSLNYSYPQKTST